MYQVNYDHNTGVVSGYHFIGNKFVDGVIITEDQRRQAFDGSKIAKVIDGKFFVEDVPGISLENQKQIWLNRLNFELQKARDQVDADFTADLASGLTLKESQQISKEEKVALKNDYAAKLEKILAGENPFVEVDES